MEYKLKLTLMDELDRPLVSTAFDEKWLEMFKDFHNINVLDEMVRVMKLQHETGSPVDMARSIGHSAGYHNGFIDGMKDRLLARRGKRLDGVLQVPIEEGVMVTREDVQDYTAFYGGNGEEAYKKLKAFYLGEIDTL